MEGEGYGWRFRGAWRGGTVRLLETDANSRADGATSMGIV